MGPILDPIGVDGPRWFVEKPAGLPVFPPHADPEGDCVLARVLRRWPERREGWPSGFEGGIAHRLDNRTSGVLLLARSPGDLAAIRAEWPRLRKFYEFRSSGRWTGQQLVEVPIAHHPRRADRMVVRRGARTAHRGKWYPAWTRIGPIGARWEAEIRTGVMHQVRVHAAFVGLPLDGDPLYGGIEGEMLLHHREMWGEGWRSPVSAVPT